MKTKQEIFEELQEFVSKTLDLDVDQIKMESKLSELSTDSIQLFELLMAFEKTYGFEVAYEDVVKLRTVNDVVEFLYTLKQ